MENEQSFAVLIKKISKWVGIILAFLMILVWVLLYAVFSANYPGVVQARKLYHERVMEPRSLPDALPYIVQVKDVGESGYTYELLGRIVNVDYASYTLTLADKGGVEWRVRMIHAPYHEANKIEINLSEIRVDRVSRLMSIVPVSLTIDRRKIEETRDYLQVGDMMDIVWRDTKKLPAIMRENRAGEYLVELAGDIVRPIGKVVGK
jgi:hypothetical protein